MATARPYPSYPFGFGSPEKWAQTGAILNEYNPIDAFWRLYNSPMAQGGPISDQNIADGLTVGGTVMGAGSVVPKPANAVNMGIKAFHGSPHSFDKFDMSKIGTGEGAQAYGHGLYFAENEGVARNYRDVLTNRAPDHIETQLISNGVSKDAANTYARWASETKGGRGSVDAFEAAMREKSPSPTINAFRQKILDEMPQIKEAAGKIGGSMYEVSINADPNHFLDWDKPLSEQPEAVRNAIPKLIESAPQPKKGPSIRNRQALNANDGSVPGDIIWNNLGGHNYPEETRKRFLEAGIPGIKYLDAGSRGGNPNLQSHLAYVKSRLADSESALEKMKADRYTPKSYIAQYEKAIADDRAQVASLQHQADNPTRNYVVFDDKLISIVRKYGIAGASALLGYNLLDNLHPAQAEALKVIEKGK